jgi:hypothetical protein
MLPVAAASAWTTAIEKLRRSQADLKERAKAGAATASAPDTTSEFNQIWSDPCGDTPTGKPFAAPPTPLVK